MRQMTAEDIEQGLPAGTAIRLYYNENNPNNGVHHVRGVVDGQLVTRSWSWRHRCWVYEVKDPNFWQIRARDGELYWGK